MSVVVTAADVYSAIDEDHPVGAIRRVGGGSYVFVPGDGSPPTEAADYDTALLAGESFVVQIEKDPKASGDALTVKKLSAELAAAQERIRQLEAKLGVSEVVEAVPAEIVK